MFNPKSISIMAKGGTRPPNGSSTNPGKPSGTGRGNNPPGTKK
jgi:hypothetical protein